jgi:hypothetical protein
MEELIPILSAEPWMLWCKVPNAPFRTEALFPLWTAHG